MNRRVDERFNDHVKRHELCQREIDQALDIAKVAAEATARAVDEATRRMTRNITLAGLGLVIVMAIFRSVPGL